jgi:SAM-dependent methyltransferase
MRSEGLERLSNLTLDKNSRDYIVMKLLIEDLTNAINKYAHGDLLDVGCGNKPYEPLFLNKIKSYTGCDVVQSSLNKVDVICEATQLEFEAEKFHTVFTTQVLEHVGNPEKMLAEIFRVLLPDGTLILSAPFTWELHEEPHDYFRFTKHGLQEILKRNGFDSIEVKANGGKWAAILQLNLNIIFSTFDNKSWLTKCLKFLFTKCRLTMLLNQIALFCDKKFYDDLLTLNYVIVAKRK